MTLPEIYCLYNRARGVELVSPEDLYKACNIKSDGEICNSISTYIKNNGNNNTKGFNAIEISKGLKIPVVLVNEYLKIAEYSGLICRDETIEGIYYYDNLFNSITFDG
ncbi:hypothetical protein PIROE2DRAFT_2762 [Piromyces sp. E2]|nr:hypothetical protein PIROE2DRAFT_2762 [Piromyces sp. E2]|eukprot:OUM69268.1 hypothetical protein PIROE2DRAFT_2762 [Piromyces sp. E2]